MIAAAFHWPPSELDKMGLGELMDWERRAERWLRARG
ncbi:MAG: GpE family phage tail protein [Sphingobacteriia bacterium]|nr:GpE family phage tail protein [Sphingobacteriia bacterium]